MTINTSRHTPGPWRNCQPSSNFEKGHAVIKNSEGKAIASVTKNFKFGENSANACLITEAGTVATECGLTPRQLLEQRNELLEVCKRLVEDAARFKGVQYEAKTFAVLNAAITKGENRGL